MALAIESAPHGVILDVGHGSAAVFVDGSSAIVVDAGSSGLVADTLERHRVTEIAALIVSHRHHDHTSELPSLLVNPDIQVRRFFANADPSRRVDSRFEEQLRGAFNVSRRRNGTEFHQANVTLGSYMGVGRLSVDLTFVGVGAQSARGGRVHPHALAVVLRVASIDGRSVLLGADLDRAGFMRLIDNPEVDLRADVLVYPHHGGLTGAGSTDGEQDFARRLTEAVSPEVVMFSNGRGRFANPRPEVVRGVREAAPDAPVRVVCTQLCIACSSVTHETEGRLDVSLASSGAESHASCAGSVRVSLSSDHTLLPMGAQHVRFVIERVGNNALCRWEPTLRRDS
jgi:beta-lactamase superfamily II metal-dependent hydrolase